MPSAKEISIARINTISGINAKAPATTTLFNVPAGKVLIPTELVIRCTSFTVGSKSIQVIASFGGNSPTFDDYINSRTFTISAAGKIIVSRAADDAEYDVQNPLDVFSIIIETGSNATLETWAIDVFGYLL